MPNPYFRFKQFTIYHDRCAMKVTTDGCLFGAWCAAQMASAQGTALDIGGGSGLLSLMVAQQTNLKIDAVELDEAAARQATENFKNSPWSNRIKMYAGAIQEFVPAQPYPFIFSNPPFYEFELKGPKAGRNVAHHGAGLEFKDLLAQMHRLLQQEGTAYLLLPHKRAGELEEALGQAGFFLHRQVVVHASTQHPPFRLLWCIRKIPTAHTDCSTLYIREGEKYSEAFTALLQPYYLYL